MSDINTEQRRAGYPFSSVWVSASAGSGKTKVLTDRVLNLLLFNSSPEKLLCLTFTKAAAAEMSNRVNQILKKWAICSDSDLAADLTALTGETPDNTLMTKARRLFASVLETPNGMKIMTIHSFCQSVLKRFPLEAGVPPSFDIIDEIKAQALLNATLDTILASPDFQSDIRVLAEYMTQDTLIDLLQQLFSHRNALIALKEQSGFQNLLLSLKKQFHVDSYDCETDIISSAFNPTLWPDIARQYLKKDGTVLSRKVDDPTAQRAETIAQALKNYKLVDLTGHLLHLAFAILESYQNQKKSAGFLDYTDLILYTKELLSHRDTSAWVLFKLDGGIDHILVDEAQDTNPDQWAIIKSLAEEFFSGEDQHNTVRTIFAVGDKKQSIYSFQGADPAEFERLRLFFEQRVRESENEFRNVPFNLSFRSTPPVLDLVNFVLKNPAARRGILSDDETAIHTAHRSDDAGLVEIWPIEPHQKTDKNEPWKPPVERVRTKSALSRLAEKIADKINTMIQSHEILESLGRPIQAGDFLILVQRRNQFVSELVRLLKDKHIPVAGIDRLNLSSHIAIQDLMAAAKFALLPQDDLNLACLLKSPLIHCSEDDLYRLAYQRGTDSLWSRVQSLMPTVAEGLQIILNNADKMPPYEFFADILGPMGGRKKFVARLGNEANEALDEFLNLTLTFETGTIPSLQLFVDYFNTQDIEIKRDMESSLNAVRIMTVHASKGLQGRIVFLPQTRHISRERSPFIWLPSGLPVWIPNQSMSGADTTAFIRQADALQDDENHRLLYVALTRASDRLYICGYDTGAKTQEDNWYDLIKNALPYTPDSDGIIRFSSPQKQKKEEKSSKSDISKPTLPAWATKPAPTEESPAGPLSPSKLDSDENTPTSSKDMENRLKALARGQFIHQLLQYLPTVPPDGWDTVITRLKPDGTDVPENLTHLLTNPEFAPIFGPDSLAEVPVVGLWQGKPLSGQIDRLVVLPDSVWIVDFKTNRHVPKTASDVSPSYRQQLSAYAGLISQIFPDKLIKTFLLWTETMSLMEVPHD